MGMKFLQEAVVDALAPKTSIIKLMQQNVGGYSPARSHKNVHASDVTKPNFCPRMYALLDITEEQKKDEYVSPAMQVTFDVGNATANLFTDQWAGDSIIGNWKCKRCSKAVSFQCKPKDGCTQLQKCDWHYEEVRFVSQDHGVSGSIDALMDLLAPKLFVTELKIIKAEDFVDIVAPLAEHRVRTSMYMKIIADSENIYRTRVNTQEARVFYISRGFGKKNTETGTVLPFKEFVVKRDDELVLPYLDKAKKIKIFRETGTIPAGICSTSMDTHAKNCAACKSCFSGAYPAGSIHPLKGKEAA
jgi:hypothetical protein